MLKLLNQTKRKSKKTQKRERDKENEKRITCRYRFVGCNGGVYFLLMKKKVQRKTISFCCQHQSNLESWREGLLFFFFLFSFLNEGAKNWNIFFSFYKIKYFKSSATNTTLLQKNSQKNLSGKLLKVGKKVMSVIDSDKNQLQLAT